EELAGWLTPLDVWVLAAEVFGKKEAGGAIWQRLQGGMIRAIASRSSRTVKDGEPVLTPTPSLIPSRYWTHFSAGASGPNFWQTTDARFFLSGDRVRASVTVRCFGIRLDPVGVGTMLKDAPRQLIFPPAAGTQSTAPAKGPEDGPAEAPQ